MAVGHPVSKEGGRGESAGQGRELRLDSSSATERGLCLDVDDEEWYRGSASARSVIDPSAGIITIVSKVSVCKTFSPQTQATSSIKQHPTVTCYSSQHMLESIFLPRLRTKDHIQCRK